MLNINPVIKRFIKVFIFGALGGGIASLIPVLSANPTEFGGKALIIASLLAAIEKALPVNL